MKNIILIILLLNIMYNAVGQTYSSFEKWMPKPTAPYSLKNTAYCESYHGGNTWVVFQVDSLQGSTIKGRHQWLMRMDMDGNNLWSKKLVCNDAYVHSIVSTPDDGVLLTGQIQNGGYWAGWLCKADKDGNIQWARRYNDVTPYSSTVFSQSICKDGYYYAYGGRSFASVAYLSLTKLDTLGNMIWTKFYRDTTYDSNPGFGTNHIFALNNKEIVFTSNTVYLGYIAKVDTSGSILFQKVYKPKYYSLDHFRLKSVIPIKNHLLIFCNYNLNSMFVIDSLGKVIWNNYYNTYDSKAFQIPILYKNGRVYCQTGKTSGVYDFSVSPVPSYASIWYNDNISQFTQPWYVCNPENTTDKIILIPENATSLNRIYIRKSDTTLITNCPQTIKTHKDTIPLIQDTVSNFYIHIPIYNTTPLGGFRTESLNLEWTFECGKLAPSSIISQDKPTFNLVLYPNPAQESITLRTDLKKYDIRVWDSYGKLLQSVQNIQQRDYMLPITHLPQGVYHIECISNHQHYVQSFVKIQ